MGMDSAPIPTAAFFGAACFRCFTRPSSIAGNNPLKRCGACRRVRYCSNECAQADWRDHKPFCQALSAIRATLPPFPFLPSDASARQLQARRDQHYARWAKEDDLLSAALKRDPTPAEGQLLWKEPRCGICWRRENETGEADAWVICRECGCVGWCGRENEAMGREKHLTSKGDVEGMSECSAIQLASQIGAVSLQKHLSRTASFTPDKPSAPPPQSVFIPPRILSSPQPLPRSWEDYLASLPSPAFPSSTSLADISATHLPPLSPTLTILSALRRLWPEQADRATRLTLLLLDETPETSKLTVVAMEELFHQMPSLSSIRTATVAPQDAPVKVDEQGKAKEGERVAKLPLCVACRDRGRSRSIEHVTTLSDLVLPSLASGAPSPSDVALTLAISLNSSLPLVSPVDDLSSAEEKSVFLTSISTTPEDQFWYEQVFAPLARTVSSSSPSSHVGLLITAQTYENLSSSTAVAWSLLLLPQTGGNTQQPARGTEEMAEGPAKRTAVEVTEAWSCERNVWRDPRPRVEGWWDHREGAIVRPRMEDRGDDPVGRRRDEEARAADSDGGTGWGSGWWTGFRVGSNGGV